MRSRIIRAAALGCACAVIALAQQQLTVDKLLEFIRSSIQQKMQDKEVAGYLAGVKLTEKLDPRTVETLQGQGAGPKTVAALNRLAEMSASLTPPAPKAPPPAYKPPPPPSYEEQQKILNEVREYALNYSKSLPDFICLQVTRRYIDRRYKPGEEGSWAVSDRLAEKLTYFEQHEKYEPISQNDNALYGKNYESIGGALSRGEFGTLLREIFEPESSTRFQWERWGRLRGNICHVYTYAVDMPHSKETLTYHNEQSVTPGYHGEIFVQKGANVILRITLEPEPPASFPMQNVHQVLDYSFIDISGQKFLLPLFSEVIMRADGIGTRNEIEFRGYRKYSADTSIKFDDSDDTSVPEDQKHEQPQPKQ
jgi:hypothetical protein